MKTAFGHVAFADQVSSYRKPIWLVGAYSFALPPCGTVGCSDSILSDLGVKTPLPLRMSLMLSADALVTKRLALPPALTYGCHLDEGEI